MAKIEIDSPAVASYLGILQGVINRMAANSSRAKTWCIALVSAMLVIIADKGKPDLVWVCVFPILLFLFLDAYYLDLEKRVREQYNEFIRKLHHETADVEDLFIVSPDADAGGRVFARTGKAIGSLSVWPFYGLLAITLLLIRFGILAVPVKP